MAEIEGWILGVVQDVWRALRACSLEGTEGFLCATLRSNSSAGQGSVRTYRAPRVQFISALLASLSHCLSSLETAMPHVSEIDVPGYLPSTSALSKDQRVLLCPRDEFSASLFRNTVLNHQPFPGCRIHQRQIDFVSVLSAEVLERSVGDKRIQEPELSLGDESPNVIVCDAQELGRSLP